MEAPYGETMEMHLRSLGSSSDHGLRLNKRILGGVMINLAGLHGYTGQRINLMNLDCLNFAKFQILSRSHFRIALRQNDGKV